MKNKLQVPILTGVLIAVLALIYFRGAQLGFVGGLTDHLIPGAVSSGSYLKVIEERTNLSDVYDAYYTLGKRKNPIALEPALEDIHSDDDYLWLNAGHYLGILRREEAVPFLIKALRHTAWRSDEERVARLQGITGQEYGNDFEEWKRWWVSENPAEPMDWSSSLGFRPRIDEEEQDNGNSG